MSPVRMLQACMHQPVTCQSPCLTWVSKSNLLDDCSMLIKQFTRKVGGENALRVFSPPQGKLKDASSATLHPARCNNVAILTTLGCTRSEHPRPCIRNSTKPWKPKASSSTHFLHALLKRTDWLVCTLHLRTSLRFASMTPAPVL
jgi:hypothetical protein